MTAVPAILPPNARFSVLLGGVALGVAFLGGRRKLLEGVDRVVAIGDRRIGRQPHHIETPAHIESERIHADELIDAIEEWQEARNHG